MRFLIPALAIVSASLSGAEPAPVVPTTFIAVPDMARLAHDLDAGPLGRVAAVAEVRQWREGLAARYALDAAWFARFRRSGMLRAAMGSGRISGGLPLVEATLALLVSPDEDRRRIPGLHVERAGAWWLAALGAPALPELPRTTSQGQIVATTDLVSSAVSLPGDWPRLVRNALAGVQVRQAEIGVQLDAGGSVEQGFMPEARLPLRPVDLHALDGFPRPALVLAAGIDGRALGSVSGVLASLCLDAEQQAALVQRSGLSLAQLAEGLDGTVACAVLPGDRPVLVATLPASAATDALLTALVETRQAGAGTETVTRAAEGSVVVGWPGPFPLFMRRAGQRWLLGSDGKVLDAIAADSQPIPISAWQGVEQAVAVAWSDPARCAGALDLPTGLELLLGAQPGEGGGQALAALRAAYAKVPEGWLVATQDASGMRWSGRNALAPALIGLVMSFDVLAPSMVEAYAREARNQTGQRLVQIGARAIAFTKEMNGHWPGDLAELRTWARDLTDDTFVSAGHPELGQPFCYVQPSQSLPEQPVLVQDPAANGGAGSLVVYADGRLAYAAGDAMWKDAQRLVGLAQARHGAVDLDEWTVLPKSF